MPVFSGRHLNLDFYMGESCVWTFTYVFSLQFFYINFCVREKRLCLKIEVTMRAYQEKNPASVVKIYVYVVKIPAYEVNSLVQKSGHGCLTRFLKSSCVLGFLGKGFTSNIEVKICDQEVKWAQHFILKNRGKVACL